jgi:hypothetical protein
MYRISARLAKILNVADKPFGGMNMLFAGDFAQLPPAIGQEHAALYSRTVGINSTSVRQQEAAVGKALWHQVTTVVILRQNMRQRQQTKKDAQLRQALTNMRYKSCTPEDITFLRSCVTSQLPGRASITSDDFRNVSIITALNIHKDEINRLGSLRFAQETQQNLVEFFSEDSFNVPVDVDVLQKIKSHKRRGRRLRKKPMVLTENLQKSLWNQPPSTNDKGVPGKLSLCKGMPVIIRNNSATELCITRGQEAFVHSWQSTVGSRGQQVLDTLFVKLQNPPQPVQFEGLPPDVVPLPKSYVTVRCTLPNDDTITVSRQQVEVLPNFAMTDYSSQGKTRLYNPVDLNNCRTHQSYYTALSRSASAAGTCIVQGFDPKMVMGGASGALRQEFRELELLDDIMLHKYEGKLPDCVVGDCRSQVIHTFRQSKGEHYVPQNVHKAVRWSKSDPFMPEAQNTATWHLVQRGNNKDSSIATKLTMSPMPVKYHKVADLTTSSSSTQPYQSVLKRKLDDCGNVSPTPAKRPKPAKDNCNFNYTQVNPKMPSGTLWSNNSCAYDAIITILHSIWATNPDVGSILMGNVQNKCLSLVQKGFQECSDGLCTLEDVRDNLRKQLNTVNPASFPWGNYVGVDPILQHILKTPYTVLVASRRCPKCHVIHCQRSPLSSCVFIVSPRFSGTTQKWVTDQEYQLASRCCHCHSLLFSHVLYHSKPPLLFLDVSSAPSTVPTHNLEFKIGGESCRYDLRGIIYFGGGHFVSRIVDQRTHIWYHDGIETGQSMTYEGLIVNCDLLNCHTRTPVVVAYSLSQE